MNDIVRVPTGIPGFDRLIEGGLIKGSINLVVGGTGTCKTTFCSQYLWNGLQMGETGVYMTLEQEAEDIVSDMSRYGFDFQKFIDQNAIIILDQMPSSFKDLEKAAFDSIIKLGAKRFVLDSLTVGIMGLKEIKDMSALRRDVFTFAKRLRNMGVTSLLSCEIPETKPKALARFGFEEFVADGIIVLHYLEYATDSKTRSLIIRKMRKTDHGTDLYPFVVTKNGIIVKS
jgi:KaiC/GvpD/RAD55 family RecA-like ATPase